MPRLNFPPRLKKDRYYVGFSAHLAGLKTPARVPQTFQPRPKLGSWSHFLKMSHFFRKLGWSFSRVTLAETCHVIGPLVSLKHNGSPDIGLWDVQGEDRWKILFPLHGLISFLTLMDSSHWKAWGSTCPGTNSSKSLKFSMFWVTLPHVLSLLCSSDCRSRQNGQDNCNRVASSPLQQQLVPV